MKRNQSGFTLIEIAIVLVIIGLLLGGVLKGQELINSAKVKSLATDFRNIPVYIYGYQDKYRAIPGDDKMAASHVAAAGVTVTNGDGNGLIDDNWNGGANESHTFWQHVRLAGLAPGPTSTIADDYVPINSVAGEIGIQSGTTVLDNATFGAPIKDTAGPNTPIRGTYIICSKNILGKFAKQLDIQLDDGNTGTGAMMAGPYVAAGTTITADDSLDDASVYTVCMGV
ncbi:MAG: prepilin-type N-terminal cleavage/methylation domain-containing protein [Nitrosomonadales bacterium]|nr:prepilin-type N-terminal cleavage/methylation domain-containing protein [Nitrosomonadales bacterium]